MLPWRIQPWQCRMLRDQIQLYVLSVFSSVPIFIYLKDHSLCLSLCASHIALKGEMKQVYTFSIGNADLSDPLGDIDVDGGQY
jgi:hypothetical protein